MKLIKQLNEAAKATLNQFSKKELQQIVNGNSTKWLVDVDDRTGKVDIFTPGFEKHINTTIKVLETMGVKIQ